MAKRGDPEFLEIGVGERGEKRKIDVVLGKALRVLPEIELLKPVRDLLHRAAPSGIGLSFAPPLNS
jgi:hypothetical protein